MDAHPDRLASDDDASDDDASVPGPVLHQGYAAAVPELSLPIAAAEPPAPAIAWLNEELARELGYDPAWLRGPAGISLLTGRVDAQGRPLSDEAETPAEPFTTAQAYAGHQFGRPNPQLGDGRALLLGDLLDTHGQRRDLHLKGSGRTPFARAADGKAPLGPMLREAVIGEAMHAAGIPTTRALAVLTTGERIAPRRGVTPEPGALLVRVAASHLRVGTVQFAAWHHDRDVREALLAHTLERHHPAAAEAENPALALLTAVRDAQAELVAAWMGAGFVHGVMNTDNMTLSGEGIDYGPCAYLDRHRPGAVFSSIDAQGRYAYANQPGIALWNLSRLGEALLDLIDAEDPESAVARATAVLEGFEPRYREAFAAVMACKLGIPLHRPEAGAEVEVLTADLFALMEAHGLDHTGTFRTLTDDGADGVRALVSAAAGDASAAGGASDLEAWPDRWEALRERTGVGRDPRLHAHLQAEMEQANPRVIPRNQHLEAVLRAAELGDLAPVHAFLEAVRRPGKVPPDHPEWIGPGEGGEDFLTFCGT